MARTLTFLLAALVALPFVAIRYDEPPGEIQWAALGTLFIAAGIVAMCCFIIGELTQNNSQVDKLWSILPAFYVGYVAWQSNWEPRLVIMFVLVSAWAARLTFNFWRKGGYHWIPWRGEEDYRWSVLRQDPILKGKTRWTLFHFFFICGYQNALILLFTLPSIVAWQGAGTPLNVFDYLAAGALILFLAVETIADEQQWRFQTEKHRRLREGIPLGEQYEKGFCDTGLWAWVRHPNYAAEQGIWIAFYFFSVAATGRWFNWSLTGALLLCLLFLGSSDFSEKISAGKYPHYKDYMKRVARFVPIPFKKA